MNRYNNGKIYKLVNNVNDKIYVGSTCLTLAKRFYCHKTDAKKLKYPVYKYLNTIGWNNVRIVLIESVVAENKDQLLQREQHYIDLLKPELNKQSAYAYCPHGRQHNLCKDCGGASICEHNRRKRQCKDCGGSEICPHNKRKPRCKDCRGTSICPHNRIKQTCKECHPFRYYCYECEKSFSTKAKLDYHENTQTHKDWIKHLEKYCDDNL